MHLESPFERSLYCHLILHQDRKMGLAIGNDVMQFTKHCTNPSRNWRTFGAFHRKTAPIAQVTPHNTISSNSAKIHHFLLHHIIKTLDIPPSPRKSFWKTLTKQGEWTGNQQKLPQLPLQHHGILKFCHWTRRAQWDKRRWSPEGRRRRRDICQDNPLISAPWILLRPQPFLPNAVLVWKL